MSVMMLNNTTTSTQDWEDLNCPVYSKSDLEFLDSFSFWVEGVLQTTLAFLGIIGNILASIIISRKEMRNSFNLLLVSLACFDSTYLFGSILESFRKIFDLASDMHIILFPHLLYPFNQVAISGSIFMTVAIAWERYIAVHYPLDYNQVVMKYYFIHCIWPNIEVNCLLSIDTTFLYCTQYISKQKCKFFCGSTESSLN